MVGLNGRERVGAIRRLGPRAAAIYAAIWPLLQITVVHSPGATRELAIAGAATLAYLPFYWWLVIHWVDGRRAPRDVLALTVIVVLIVAVTPTLGASWLPTYHVIAVSALLLQRRRWSWLACAAVVLSQVIWGQALRHVAPDAPAYYAITVVWRAASVFVPLWLVRAALELENNRRRLADQAVVGERLRIDDALRTNVAPLLSEIVRRGTALDGAELDRRATTELLGLVEDSRLGLADVRRLIRSYRQVSLRGELETAVVLLQAAGLDVRLDLHPSVRDEPMDDLLRASLNDVVTELLRNEPTGRWVLRAHPHGGRTSIAALPAADPTAIAAMRS